MKGADFYLDSGAKKTSSTIFSGIKNSIRNKIIILFIFISTGTIAIIGVISDYQITKHVIKNIGESFSSDLNDKNIKMNALRDSIKNDLNLLSGETLQNLITAIDAGGKNEVTGWQMEPEDEYLKLAEVKKAYNQIRYIDDKGKEIARIDFDGTTGKIIPQDKLQNKSEAAYFKDTIMLGKDMIYVSPLNLNVEQGRIEVPFKPVVRYAKPIFNSSGQRRGIIIANVFGSEFLKELKVKDSEKVIFINKEGYFLSHPDEKLTYGFQIEERKGEKLQKYYPDYADVILNKKSGYIDTGGLGWIGTWFYWFYSPDDVILAHKTVFPNPADETNYWAIIKLEYKKELLFNIIMKMRAVMIGLSIAVIIVSIIGSGVIASNLSKPLNSFLSVVEDIGSTWDMTRRIDIRSSDEIGKLAKGFNLFLDKFSGIINNMVVSSNRFASSSKELLALSEEISNGSAEQSSRASQVATSSTEMGATVVEMAKNASGAADAAKEASKAAKRAER